MGGPGPGVSQRRAGLVGVAHPRMQEEGGRSGTRGEGCGW